jgi:hypothetical protein
MKFHGRNGVFGFNFVSKFDSRFKGAPILIRQLLFKFVRRFVGVKVLFR